MAILYKRNELLRKITALTKKGMQGVLNEDKFGEKNQRRNIFKIFHLIRKLSKKDVKSFTNFFLTMLGTKGC